MFKYIFFALNGQAVSFQLLKFSRVMTESMIMRVNVNHAQQNALNVQTPQFALLVKISISFTVLTILVNWKLYYQQIVLILQIKLQIPKFVKTCATGYWLKTDTCTATTLTNCLTWASGATEACATIKCSTIHAKCTSCTSATVCTGCDSGYYLSADTTCTAATRSWFNMG